ncbi:MAG: hypothetical protein CMN84_04020 [Spongiibacteraceae bacterium]|jgi:hypothetical protein|nr:hypothetical protein [Spongiibacteraceae bacterium]
MKKAILAAGFGVFLAQAAVAKSYLGLSYAFFETELESGGISVDFDTPTIQFALGHQFNENLGAEFRVGLGADEDSSFGLDVEISDYFALYLKPTLPLSDTLSLYALLGVAKTTVDTSFGDDDDSDISYGFGFSADANSEVSFFAEYVSLYDDSDDGVDVEINGFNLGVAFLF